MGGKDPTPFSLELPPEDEGVLSNLKRACQDLTLLELVLQLAAEQE